MMIEQSLLPALRRNAWRHLAFGLLALSGLCTTARAEGDFLEPEQAFVLSAEAADDKTVALRFAVAPGYYLYREHFRFEATGAVLGTPDLPAGKVKFDTTFQKQVETYRGDLALRLPVTEAPGAFTLQVVYQGCADAGLCYPPITRELKVSLKGFGGDGSVTLDGVNANTSTNTSVSAPGTGAAKPRLDLAGAAPAESPATGAVASEDNRIERLLRGGSWWATLGAFWLMGLLLSFTPCVLPMLPILSSIIAGSGEVSRRRSLLLAVSYSLGMAVVYTALGVAAGLAGEGLAATLQKPWVLATFALLLAGFSLSMFDVYELRLPIALSNRLDGVSRQLPGGKFFGVFLMGGLSALIVSPCVTAPLAGALLFLSQSRDVGLAGSALFALAVGMSTPLLVLGASAGSLLPRSGVWMHAVKRFFGLLLLAVALWVVQPVLAPAAALLGWGALLLVTGFMLRPFDPHPHSGAPRVWLQRAAGLAMLSFGVMQMVGAGSGGHDPLQPLGHWRGANAAPQAATDLNFVRVGSVDELDAALRSAGRPVMLDFYADWCVSCKEMERFTFSDPAVQARLSGALLLKADVTANSATDKALLKRFNLFGPPGTIFFDTAGQEITGQRVVGFQSARDFEKTLQRAGL